jgi:hypothetical protein
MGAIVGGKIYWSDGTLAADANEDTVHDAVRATVRPALDSSLPIKIGFLRQSTCSNKRALTE